MKLQGALSRSIREALCDAFDYEDLVQAMSDVDIDMARFTSEARGKTRAAGDLVAYAEQFERVDDLFRGAIEANDQNSLLKTARAEYLRWQAPSTQSPSPTGASPWTAPTIASAGAVNRPPGPGVARGTGPIVDGGKAEAPLAGRPDEGNEPTDLPAGLARSEWDSVWAEVWNESWPAMLDDMRIRLWMRVARMRSSPSSRALQSPAAQAQPAVQGTRFQMEGPRDNTRSNPGNTSLNPSDDVMGRPRGREETQ